MGNGQIYNEEKCNLVEINFVGQRIGQIQAIIFFLDSGPYDSHTSLCQRAARVVGYCANQGTLLTAVCWNNKNVVSYTSS